MRGTDMKRLVCGWDLLKQRPRLGGGPLMIRMHEEGLGEGRGGGGLWRGYIVANVMGEGLNEEEKEMGIDFQSPLDMSFGCLLPISISLVTSAFIGWHFTTGCSEHFGHFFTAFCTPLVHLVQNTVPIPSANITFQSRQPLQTPVAHV